MRILNRLFESKESKAKRLSEGAIQRQLAEATRLAEEAKTLTCSRCSGKGTAIVQDGQYWCSWCNDWLLSEKAERDRRAKHLAEEASETEEIKKKAFEARFTSVSRPLADLNEQMTFRCPSLCASCGQSGNHERRKVKKTSYGTYSSTTYEVRLPICQQCRSGVPLEKGFPMPSLSVDEHGINSVHIDFAEAFVAMNRGRVISPGTKKLAMIRELMRTYELVISDGNSWESESFKQKIRDLEYELESMTSRGE